MFRLLTFALFVLCFISSFGQNPTEIDGLELWLRGDDIEVSESQLIWNDLSGNENDATQSVQANIPVVASDNAQINYQSYVKFDGVNDRLLVNHSINIGSVFVVANHTSASNFPDFDGILTGQSGTNDRVLFIARGNTQNLYNSGFFGTNIEVNQISSLDFSPLENWKIVKGIGAAPSIFESLIIGSDRGSTARLWEGGIAEIIIFSTILSESEAQIIVNYLVERYTPSIGFSPEYVQSNFCEIVLDAGDGFTSYEWSDGSIEQTKTADRSEELSIEVISSFNQIISASSSISYPGTFLSDFSLCAGSDSLWQSGLEAFDVEWQDGSTDYDYEITEAGQYYLTVTDGEGCSFSSDTVDVVMDAFPLEVELYEADVFCLGNSLYLSGGAAEAEQYLWSTDETTAMVVPPSDGAYWVEAWNANGCLGRDTIDLVMAGVAPTVDFAVGTACETREVMFADETIPDVGNITEQNWVFGEGPFDSAQGAVVDYSFAAAGQYPVELTVLLDNGCTGTKWDTVLVSPLPLVNFNYDAVVPCAGNAVAFESQSGVPGGGVIASWDWRFGNGTEDTGIVGSTTFEDLGSNSVLHIVASTAGCSDSLFVPVVVLGSPVVDFSFDTVCVGMATGFYEEVDVSESGSVFYQWQFGDGFFSNFPNTSHVYDAAGAYTVSLKATGNDFGNPGCVDIATKTVRVFDAPVAVIDLQDACVGAGAALVDLTAPTVVAGEGDPVVSRLWEVALGPNITEEIGGDSLQYFFPGEAGTYPILFDFETESGCVGTANGLVDLMEIPMADFSLDVPTVAPPLVVVPENYSSHATSYTWYVNGEVVSHDAEPELMFADTGNYVVALQAENGLGCSDLAEETVRVFVPVYDLALLDVQYSIVGERVYLTAVLSNYGNAVIENFDMEVTIGKDINFSMHVEEEIGPGEVVYHALGQGFSYLPQRNLPYSCMVVSDPNGVSEEEDYENNAVCVGLDKEKVTFIAPYPNPVSGVLHLGFVLPRSGEMEVTLVNSVGMEVMDLKFDLSDGYSVVDLDLSGLSEGLYVLSCGFEGEENVERVVVVD